MAEEEVSEHLRRWDEINWDEINIAVSGYHYIDRLERKKYIMENLREALITRKCDLSMIFLSKSEVGKVLIPFIQENPDIKLITNFGTFLEFPEHKEYTIVSGKRFTFGISHINPDSIK